jgi:MoaA/NifB/PqqE/SkfB family radical SAM enzyme
MPLRRAAAKPVFESGNNRRRLGKVYKRLSLLCGYTCNNNCLFCFVKGRPVIDRPTDEIKRILRTARKDEFDDLVFNGGESTIRTDFVEIVEYANKLDFPRIRLVSNGRMFYYKEFAQKVAKAGLNGVIVSIHGSTAKTHDSLTQVPGSFNQTIKGLENLIEAGITTETNTTIVKQNYKELPDLIKFLSNFKLNCSEFIFVNPGGAALQNFETIVPTFTESIPFLRNALKVHEENGNPHNLIINSVPHCFIEGYTKYIPPTFKMEKSIIGVEFRIDDVDKSRIEKAKVKSKECLKCKYNNQCEGVWQNYAERYGLGELKPVVGPSQ